MTGISDSPGQQDGNRGNRQGHPDEVLAQVTAQPRPQKGKRQAADDLVDAQGDRHEGVDGGKRTPCEHGRGDPCCGAFCRDDREESADGSREHHPLDAKVQHSRSFAEDLSQGGIKQRRAGAHGRGHQRDEGSHFHVSAPPACDSGRLRGSCRRTPLQARRRAWPPGACSPLPRARR